MDMCDRLIHDGLIASWYCNPVHNTYVEYACRTLLCRLLAFACWFPTCYTGSTLSLENESNFEIR